MFAEVKVGMQGGMLVILLVEVFGRGTALGLDSLQISGFKRLKSAPANSAVNFAGIEVNWCCGGSNSDCC